MPVSFSATRPVNPPGHAGPKIEEEQLWRGIVFKAKNPKAFVPAITESRVVEEEGNKIVRVVRFGDGPEKREEITVFPNTIAYFEMYPVDAPSPSSSSAAPPPDARITNTISYGPPPSHDLFLTFSFSSLPHVSEEQAKGMSREEMNEQVGKGVEGTIEVIRGMVRDGKL
ncbi:hypothetical protein JCM6882_007622 [Rhodosporidiobolus microsporus]